MNRGPPRLLFVVNHAKFFLSHRKPIALAARRAGLDVHVATMPGPYVDQVREAGFNWHELPLEVRSINPVREVRLVGQLMSLYRHLDPAIVHHVTMKPVTYGSLAARAVGVPAVVNAFSGFGYLFIANGWRTSILRETALFLMRMGFKGNSVKIVVQNPDDARILLGRGIACIEQLDLVRGSGVDIERFRATAEPEGDRLVVLPSRMLRDKGVEEFVAAARILYDHGVDARFVLVGDVDPNNPRSLTLEELRDLDRQPYVEWWGFREDMRRILGRALLVCLPSYREGLPKVLLEAAAVGRAVVATDVPGCREVVTHGVNGLLVPARDPEKLAEALDALLGDSGRRRRMARANRERVEQRFSLERVVRRHMQLYDGLLPGGLPRPLVSGSAEE